jgi:uncharacterized protein (UPF0276 family)
MAEVRTGGAVSVGVLFNPIVPEVLRSEPAADHLAVIPESLWVDRGPGITDRFGELTQTAMAVEPLLAELPVVAHGISLSIGSALPLDDEHLEQMAAWCARHGAHWYSEHLGFFAIADHASAVGRRHTGLGLPVACDHETIALLAPRIARVRDVTGLPFLLENGVNYTPLVEEEMTEPALFNRLGEEVGCDVLLDLHNLYVQAVNHGLDTDDYLGELDLRLVREIHVAGGIDLAGMYTDAHSGAVPEAVWRLLGAVAGECPNLDAVTFEFHESCFVIEGATRLAAQLHRGRQVLRAAGLPTRELADVAA